MSRRLFPKITEQKYFTDKQADFYFVIF